MKYANQYTPEVVHGEGTRSRRLSPEYVSWRNMRNRCTNPNVEAFADYGGRGITVCERWQWFVNFVADMGRKPTPEHELDRIDNDGDYEPGNCRWATPLEQRRNRRDVRFYDFNGERLLITEIAARTGLQRQTIEHRLKRGWPQERAFSEPAKPTGRK